MTETLSLSNNEFYVVMDGEESLISADQTTAIAQLKNGSTPSVDDIPQIIRVEFDGAEDWTLRELEWKQIALELMMDD
jgi:hypothetical protein